MSHDDGNNRDTAKETVTTGASGKLIERSRGDDDCRCKESKGKTVAEMLRLMVNDLLFWKKERKS